MIIRELSLYIPLVNLEDTSFFSWMNLVKMTEHQKGGYGYYPKGTRRPSGLGNFIRKHRVSIMSAMDQNGVFGSIVVEGSFYSELFNFAAQQAILNSLGICVNNEPRSVVGLG